MPEFTIQSSLRYSQQMLFDYHMSPGALARLIPPWEGIRILSKSSPQLELNSEVTLRVPILGGISKVWRAKHTELTPPQSFTDQQIAGPFQKWIHRHSFIDDGAASSILRDSVEYELPFHPISTVLSDRFIRAKLEANFGFRHVRTAKDLQQASAITKRHSTVLITGASGLVGRNLRALLETQGYSVLTLSRKKSSNANCYLWDISKQEFPLEALERADAVIHLAGEGIAEKRWNQAQKEKIRKSRVAGTRLIVDSFRKVSDKPKTFISASATGYYGDRGEEELSESSSAGNMFVSQVAKEWEEEAAKASELGIRTVIPRIGIVLTPEGGALRKMLPAFSAGVAGPLGAGAQWMSCIGIDDLIYAIQFLLEQERSEGAYNLTCPEPLTNATFTKALGTVVRRPTVIPVPEFALNLAFGEMAEELLLASVKALPHRLLEEGFTFSFPTVMSTLKFVLGRQL